MLLRFLRFIAPLNFSQIAADQYPPPPPPSTSGRRIGDVNTLKKHAPYLEDESSSSSQYQYQPKHQPYAQRQFRGGHHNTLPSLHYHHNSRFRNDPIQRQPTAAAAASVTPYDNGSSIESDDNQHSAPNLQQQQQPVSIDANNDTTSVHNEWAAAIPASDRDGDGDVRVMAMMDDHPTEEKQQQQEGQLQQERRQEEGQNVKILREQEEPDKQEHPPIEAAISEETTNSIQKHNEETTHSHNEEMTDNYNLSNDQQQLEVNNDVTNNTVQQPRNAYRSGRRRGGMRRGSFQQQASASVNVMHQPPMNPHRTLLYRPPIPPNEVQRQWRGYRAPNPIYLNPRGNYQNAGTRPYLASTLPPTVDGSSVGVDLLRDTNRAIEMNMAMIGQVGDPQTQEVMRRTMNVRRHSDESSSGERRQKSNAKQASTLSDQRRTSRTSSYKEQRW